MSGSTQTAVVLLGFWVLVPADLRADEPPEVNARVANAKARAEAAGKVYELMLKRSQVAPNSPPDPEKLYQWSRRWMEADQELSDKKEDRIAAAESHLKRMKKLEADIKQMIENKSGFIGQTELAAQTFFRLEAERSLAQVKDK